MMQTVTVKGMPLLMARMCLVGSIILPPCRLTEIHHILMEGSSMQVTFGILHRCKQCVEVYMALFFLGYTMETKTESNVYCEFWTGKGATTCIMGTTYL